jgi:hypothetical protein
MRKLLSAVVIAALAWFVHQHVTRPVPHANSGRPAPEDSAANYEPEVERSAAPAPTAPTAPSFHCDGRVYCSQMTSCDEAMYFLQHCPGVKMDGEGDGIPCEKQWCGHH